MRHKLALSVLIVQESFMHKSHPPFMQSYSRCVQELRAFILCGGAWEEEKVEEGTHDHLVHKFIRKRGSLVALLSLRY